MNDRLKLWGRILGVLALCILVSFVILLIRADAYPFILAAWALALVLGLPGMLVFWAFRNFGRTLRCCRQGTAYAGTCTDKRFQARESLYVVEWEDESGLQTEAFTAGVRPFARPPFPVTVYVWGESRCLGRLAVVETGCLALLFLLILIGAAVPVILMICDLCSGG